MEGWGICYKEGWNMMLIARLVFVLLLMSLIFDVVWTKVNNDIQGAFGVASWIVAVGGTLMVVVLTSVNSL